MLQHTFERSTIQSRSRSISSSQAAFFGTATYGNHGRGLAIAQLRARHPQRRTTSTESRLSQATASHLQSLAPENAPEAGGGEQSFVLQKRTSASVSPSPIKGRITKTGPRGAAAQQMAKNEELYAKQSLEKAQKQLKYQDKYYCIFPGNGYNILRAALQKKRGWREMPKEQAFSGRCNFIWKPTNFNYKQYCQIDSILHHGLLAQERQLFGASQQGLDPLTYEFDTSTELVVNHLEHNREITTKTGLVRSLKAYYKDNIHAIDSGYQVFDTTPTTFVVSSNLDTYEYHQFCKRFQDLAKNDGQSIKERMPPKYCKQNMWLVKPANENQGKGIRIFDDMDQIIKFLESSMNYSYWVIQKYIERPLCYRGRKFDVRVWAVALSNLDFLYCDTGYIRTSSADYAADAKDEYVHLTNNCLQMKDEQNYGKHEQGNTLSYGEFQSYLDETFPTLNLDVQRDFVSRMKDLTLDCFLSAKNTMNPSKRRNCFEFFGFDFMIDEDFRIWLIEANTNPYIGIHNTGMKNVLPEMLDGLYKIVLDPVFENMTPEKEDRIWENTGWDLLYSRIRGINKRRDINAGIYPVKHLSQKRELPRRYKKKKLKLKNVMESPWTDEQRRLRRQQEAKKRELQEIGERANGKPTGRISQSSSVQNRMLSGSKSQQVIGVQGRDFNNKGADAQDQKDKKEDTQTFGGNDMHIDDVRPSLPKATSQVNIVGPVPKKQPAQQRAASRQSNMSAQSIQDTKFNAQRNSVGPSGQRLSRSIIANQMKYKNQQQFIPQPHLDMAALSPNQKLQKKDLSKSKSSDFLELKGLQAPGVKDDDIDKSANRENEENSSSGEEEDSDSDYEEFQRNQRNKEGYAPHDDPRHQASPMGQTNDEAMGGMRAEKNIVAQVANLDTRSKFYKQTVLEIMNRIVSTMTSWELFSDNQIQDANAALKMLQQTLIYSPEDQKPIIRALIRLVGSNEVPLHIRFQIAVNVYLMFKNKVFMKLFVQDGVEAHMTLVPLYNILLETCVPEEKGGLSHDNMEELYFECVNILTLIMSLNGNRYHIPGETVERNRMRQNAIDTGALIVVMYLMKHTKNEHLRTYIQEEFFEKVDETDFEYHFTNNHSHYAMVSTIITDAKQRQELDEIMKERMGALRQGRLIQERMNLENRRKEQEKEEQLQRELEAALQEKRRLAEQKMDQRIRELNKIKAQNQKEELRQKQQLEQINQERKLLQQEEFKKKQEMRKKQQKQLLELKQQQEREMQEEIIKRNKDREIAKKIALDKWHQQKREEEKRRKNAERVRVKGEKGKFIPAEYQVQDDKFKEYESRQQRKKAMQILKEYSGDFFNVDLLQSRGGIKKNRAISYGSQVQDFIALQSFAQQNCMSPAEQRQSVEHPDQLRMPRINVNSRVQDPSETSHLNAALSARPPASGNPAQDSRLSSADRQNFRSPIVQGLEDPARYSRSVVAPAIKSAVRASEQGNPTLDIHNLNKSSLDQLNFARDQQHLVNQSTSLPQINYQGAQPLNGEKQPNTTSQSNLTPASITIINNDYSQTHFNNYYMARQQSSIKKTKNALNFEDKLALKALKQIEAGPVLVMPSQGNYSSNPPDIDQFLKITNLVNPAQRNSISNRSSSIVNHHRSAITSSQQKQFNLITDMEDVLERRATKIKQLPSRQQSSSQRVEPAALQLSNPSSANRSRMQARKFNSFQQSPPTNLNVIKIKSEGSKTKKSAQAVIKDGFQIYHHNTLASGGKELMRRPGSRSPIDALLELQESQLKTIYDKQASNLFHGDSALNSASRSSPQPGRPQKRTSGPPLESITAASQAAIKAPYIFKDLGGRNQGRGSTEASEAPAFSKSYLQDLITLHQQAIPSLLEIQSANESSSHRFKQRLNEHLSNEPLPKPRGRGSSKQKPQQNSQLQACGGAVSSQRQKERSPMNQLRANKILSGQGIASSAFKGFPQRSSEGAAASTDARD